MGLEQFAIVFAPCWLRNPSDDARALPLSSIDEIAFAKEALIALCSDQVVGQPQSPSTLPDQEKHFLIPDCISTSITLSALQPKVDGEYRRRRAPCRKNYPGADDANPSQNQTKLGGPDDEAAESKALYLGVALEEQCACEWSGLRIPAVLAGMLSALSTPVDAMLEAWSAGLTFDECNAAAVFGEIESLCVGCPGDADTVCGAIVTKRSAHGAGLDVGLLRLWLRRLPDAVSFSCDVLFLG
jgi:hypothetical protein